MTTANAIATTDISAPTADATLNANGTDNVFGPPDQTISSP
jgi:hypothetical protein